MGGTSPPKPQTPTYQQPKPKQQTTNQTTGQTTNRITKGTDQKKPDTYETTAVTADDFLRGFNKGYEENEIATAPERRDPSFWDLTVNSYKQGYNNAARGQEAWKSMHGQENELDKYNELLSSDEYNFETDDWWEQLVSGASGRLGQWIRQLTDPETAALAIGSGGMALLAGQAGPQALLPEEVLTVPGAFALGMKAGNAKTNMEIEGGNAYLEMLENGVSEETARAIATGVGGINALLETAQLDELLKAYKVLGKAGADDAFLDVVLRELKNRGIDTVTETLQEDLQELATIGGTQLGSKIDTGEWAYNLAEVLQRLWDTTKESALTYGLMNVPSTVYNTHVQNQSRLVAEHQRSQLIAEGKQRILSGEMPTDAQLAAMKLDKAEVLGDLISYWLGGMDETELQKKVEQYSQVQYHEDGTVVVTDDWTGRNHPHLPQKYIPNAVIDTLSQNGRQHDRTFFNSTGLQDRQVSNGGHSNRKQHPYGINGEHAHDILWEDGGIIGRPHRELINFEREENSDIL